jgi:hypothetical protein
MKRPVQRAFVIVAAVLVARGALGAGAGYYVKKGTWQETLQASREALVEYLSKPDALKVAVGPRYGPWF